MKALLFYLLLLGISKLTAQTFPIEFKGGYNLEVLLFKHTSLQFDYTKDSLSRYFNIILEIDKAGNFGSITIESINDTATYGGLFKAIQLTQGLWINHSDSTQTIVIPVFWEYEGDDGKISKKVSTIRTAKFLNGKEINLFYWPTLFVKFIKGQN